MSGEHSGDPEEPAAPNAQGGDPDGVTARAVRGPEVEAAAPAAPPNSDGPRLAGRYRVVRELGRGGMGRVLIAVDEKLGREVALKELLVDVPHLRDRFSREVRLSAVLQHPSIVCLYDSFELENGLPCYLMRVVSGHPLDDLLGERPRLADRLAFLSNVIQVCDAVAYAHEQGVIHRDLKPGNVMVGRFGETVVIDWGLAKQLHETEFDRPASESAPPQASSGGRLTLAGELLGTPAYMAPEQARGEPATPRSDVYALGAMLFEMLAGRPPYPDGSHAEVLRAIRSGPPDFAALENREVPTELLGIARHAMHPNPAERYASAAELAADLRRFQTGQLVRAHTYSSWDLARRWVVRHRIAVGGVAAALAAALITAGSYWRWARIAVELCDAVVPAIPELQGSAPPRCLHPLDPDAQAQRQVSFRLERSRGRVTRIERINGLGYLAHNRFDDFARWDLAYDEAGHLREEVVSSALGDFRERWVFSADMRRAERRDLKGAPLERVTSGLLFRNDAAVAQRDLDSHGRVVRVQSTNVFGAPRPMVAPWMVDDLRVQTRGTFGFRLLLDSEGQIATAVSLGPDGTEQVDGDGIRRRTFVRDPDGRRATERYFDAEDRPVTDGIGVAGKTTEFDVAGNPVLGFYVAPDGGPARSFIGLSRYRVTYDRRGNPITWEALGADGQPVIVDHSMVDDFDGYALARRTYDDRGINTGTEFLDVHGRPVVTRSAGCARFQLVPDERGQIVEEGCLDTEGRPAIYRYFGAASIRFEHDAWGYLSGTTFFGPKGEAMVGLRSGCAQVRTINDLNNNTIDRRCLGLDGQPLVSDPSYEPPGYPIRSRPRYAHQTFSRDAEGRKVGEAFFDAQDRPQTQREGYAARTFRLDEAGNAVETTLLGIDGKLVAGVDGVAREKAEYDVFGHQTRLETFDVDGQRVISKATGAAILSFQYNAYGRATEIVALTPEGRPTLLSGDTYAIRRLRYNERGSGIEMRFFDPDGGPVACTEGYAIVRRSYDDHIFPYEEAYFDASERPVVGSGGYARVSRTFGAGTQVLQERYWSPEGRPTTDRRGAYGYRQDYDDRGNLIRRVVLGPSLVPVADRDGLSYEERTYDELDQLTELSRHGTDGGPVVGADGAVGWRAELDSYGRETRRVRLGIDGGELPAASEGGGGERGLPTQTGATRAIDW